MSEDCSQSDRTSLPVRLAATLRNYVRDHRSGVLFDLLFALVWVGVVTVLAGLLGGPQWAHSATMAAGVLAYYGFVWSLSSARDEG